MAKYRIADLIVDMKPSYGLLKERSLQYLTDDCKQSDFSISVSKEAIAEKARQSSAMNEEMCEYAWYGYEFYKKLLHFNGMLLHSSCIAVDGEAYLFSAPSGTGKSTHTGLWKEYFKDRAVFVNDDKPALRIFDGSVFACGTPFSGKTSLSTNIIVPVKGICILNRGVENSIKFADKKTMIHKLLNQSYRPVDPELMDLTLDMLDKVIEKVPVYELFCNISTEAVLTSYEFMSKN